MSGRDKDKGGEGNEEKMDWRDYLAFIIALLTTHLLPLFIIAIVIILLSYFIVHLFG